MAHVVIENNIFDNLSDDHIALEPCVADVSTLANNLFWNDGGNITVAWGNSTFLGLDPDALNAAVNGTGNIIGGPHFTLAGSFFLGSGSAAMDAGKVPVAYETFFSNYGIDIRKDLAGRVRPQGAGWDVGAYEFIPALTLNGFPRDKAIHLHWTVNTTLPVTATWQLTYFGPPGDQISPITGISNAVRAYTLTGLTNYTPYTISLNAMLAGSPWLTDTVPVMPSDRLLFLPVVPKAE